MRLKLIAKSENGIVRREDVKVVDADTGELLQNVVHVEWSFGVDHFVPIATIQVVNPELDIDCFIMSEPRELEVYP